MISEKLRELREAAAKLPNHPLNSEFSETQEDSAFIEASRKHFVAMLDAIEAAQEYIAEQDKYRVATLAHEFLKIDQAAKEERLRASLDRLAGVR